MKKILSTFVMCVILGVGSVWAVDATLNITIKTVVRTSPTDPNGEVVANVCTQEIEDGETVVDCAGTKSGYWNLTASMEVPESHGCTAGFPDYTSDYKNKAIILSGSANLSSECSGGNYVFSHWEASSGVTIKNPSLGAVGICSFSVEKKQGELFNISSSCNFPWINRSYTVKPRTGVTQTITFTAVWIQPQVTSVTVNNCGEVTDPTTPSADGQFAFVLNNDLAANNYTYITNDLEAKHFSVKSNKYTKGSYVFAIGYQPTGVHGTYSATMTLTSNYPVSTDPAEKSKTATIQVVENYRPKFTTVDSYDFGAVPEGSFKQTAAGDFSLVKNNYAANNATWTAWIENNAHGLYQIQDELGADGKYHPISGEPSVRFTPNAELSDDAYTATLYLKATYTDANGNEVVSETKEILLNAVSYTPGASSILFAHNELDFGTVYLSAELPQKNTYLVRELVKENSIQLSGFSESVFDCSYADGNVYVGIKSDVACGDYNITVTATADKSDGNGSVTDDIILNAKIRLTTPELTALGGVGVVTLSWKPVYGADYYIIQRGGSEIYRTTDNSTTSYLDKTVTNGNTYSYKVIAVYTANTTYNTFSETTATEGLPTIITPTNATSTGLSTGTTHPSNNTFPYKLKEDVVLTRCFGISGNALFDVLYIFGLTTNTEGGVDVNLPSVSDGCNAKTPCYVYHKSVDGTHYVYNTTFDAVSTRFDHGTAMNGKHLYFTGYCPFAYMGVNSTEEGWMYFTGGNTTVDIYLDNCQILGRYKTPSGANNGYNTYTLQLYADVGTIGGDSPNESLIYGSSSPFVFTSTTKNSSTSYKPTIHIAGTNHLQGQLGSYITNTEGIVTMWGYTLTSMDAGINNIYTYSAPITIKPIDLGAYTDLELTDIWIDNTITNGYLRLNSDKAGSPSEKVIAIDLGSPKGSLTINGGQYHLRNSAADGTYACNLAVGYRMFSKMVEKAGMKMLLHLYGFGGDMTYCKVTINSGTFTMYKNMYFNGEIVNGDSVYLGEGYYKDQEEFLDLRLPAGDEGEFGGTGLSRINGGTFNGISNVLMCSRVTTTGASPTNNQQDWLCLQDVEITEYNLDGSPIINIPPPFDGAYDNEIVYNLVNGMEDVKNAYAYGAQSANAFEKDGISIVRLLLPGTICEEGDCLDCEQQKEALIFQWATAIPKFDVSKTVNGNSESVQVGGLIKVQETPVGEDVEYQTNQLLFMDCAGMEDYSMNLPEQGAAISFNDKSLPRGQISNLNNYEIKKNLNILKSVQADTWYTFTAPFNVHDISVIETYETIIDDLSRPEAKARQAQDNLNVLYVLQDFIIPNENGRASSLTLPALLPSTGASINKLTHYDGTNVMSANYYLYELANDVFGTDGTGDELDIVWKPVATPAAGTPILTKGKVYAMQFPWCPMCNDLYVDDHTKKRNYYDYWSNKMILFYGKGPQTIAGINSHSEIIFKARPTTGATATLAGNPTFADMTLVAGDNAYVHNPKNDYFELNKTDYPLKPTEGFMLYNPGPASMPARILRSGQIEYDENVETGLPTIAGRTSLMLFGAYDGIEVLALHEQLVTVYNLQGNIIFQQYMAEGEQLYVATGAGVFIVRGDSETIKVMVE